MVMCELAFAGKTEIQVKQRFRKALGLISKRRSLQVEANCFLYLQECLGLFGHSQKFCFLAAPLLWPLLQTKVAVSGSISLSERVLTWIVGLPLLRRFLPCSAVACALASCSGQVQSTDKGVQEVWAVCDGRLRVVRVEAAVELERCLSWG